jgi:hypothetical protein
VHCACLYTVHTVLHTLRSLHITNNAERKKAKVQKGSSKYILLNKIFKINKKEAKEKKEKKEE